MGSSLGVQVSGVGGGWGLMFSMNYEDVGFIIGFRGLASEDVDCFTWIMSTSTAWKSWLVFCIRVSDLGS